ncbi:MAG: phospholipase D-like domain-containing protein, partial [Halobacteriales archaeon]|nr:phospholipase D-like domain-containing protein [Halobacteriales archaeon]
SLDIESLQLFQTLHDSCSIVNLPRLHAKVYVADSQRAIVTSGNLTPSGLDKNFEYGVGLADEGIVRQVRRDLAAYAKVGSILDNQQLEELAIAGKDLAKSFKAREASLDATARRRFNVILRATNDQMRRARVGKRSAQGLFSDAILFILTNGPLTTKEIAPQIQALLPELCDDDIELVINNERFGKAWKHGVRNAQQQLKRQGILTFDGIRWHAPLHDVSLRHSGSGVAKKS